MTMRRRVLEVGSGTSPLPRYYKSFQRLPEGVEYHAVDILRPMKSIVKFNQWYKRVVEPVLRERYPYGIDNDYIRGQLEYDKSELLENMQILAELPKLMREEGIGNITLHSMNAKYLAFANDTFDEVHMHRFVTDPDVHMSGELGLMFAEVFRVLKSGGRLIICGEMGRFKPDGSEYDQDITFNQGRSKSLIELKRTSFKIDYASLDFANDSELMSLTVMANFYIALANNIKRSYSTTDKHKNLPGGSIINPEGRIQDSIFLIVARKL